MKDINKKDTKDQRIALFDYLKAFFIFLVIITHYSWTDSERLNILFPFIVSMAIPGFMLISGYLLYMSCERKYQTSIADLYAWDILIGKFLRFTLPFLVALIVEIGFQMFNHTDISLSSVVHLYLVGGKGPGSYYYPLMIQLIFIFPALYWLMRRGSIRGLIIIGVANLTYEIMIHAYGMGAACYRLLVFRYLLMLGFGCYLYINKDEKQNKIALLIMIAIGIAYIVVTKYTGYEEKLFTYWTSTSMMTAFWIFPVFYMVYKLLRDARPSKIQIIGKASYHIFLTQMVYYGYVFRLVRGYLPDFTLIHLLVNVVFCIFLGMIFYLVENKINKIVLRKVLSWGCIIIV